MTVEPVDLLIIGGGPAGLFAAFYAGLRGMSVCIVDSLPMLGGQLATLYPEKHIYDVAGHPEILAKDLAAKLLEQGLQFGAAVALGQQASTLVFDPPTQLFTVQTTAAIHHARAVLIAAGVGAFKPRLLALPEAARFEGSGLEYGITSVEAYRGKRLLIVGGGDSAVDWANTLATVSHSQVLIHRRDVFRAVYQSVTRLRNGPTRVLTPYEVQSLIGQDRIEQVTVAHVVTGKTIELAIDAVLVNIGYESSLGPLQDWGLELQGATIRVDSAMRTNRPGVFAVGDIAIYPGKLKLIAVGFGEAATAVNHAYQYLHPAGKLFPGHSTDLLGQR